MSLDDLSILSLSFNTHARLHRHHELPPPTPHHRHDVHRASPRKLRMRHTNERLPKRHVQPGQMHMRLHRAVLPGRHRRLHIAHCQLRWQSVDRLYQGRELSVVGESHEGRELHYRVQGEFEINIYIFSCVFVVGSERGRLFSKLHKQSLSYRRFIICWNWKELFAVFAVRWILLLTQNS